MIEHAFDYYNGGEGYRNFFVCHGEERHAPEPLDTGNVVDCELLGLIDEGMRVAPAGPAM